MTEITRADYERLAHVSRSQAAYDLSDLVKRGVVERIGAGRATRYRARRNRSGRPRSWTNDRIRSELRAFCAGRDTWPSAAEFRSSGRGDLYLAVCRYGGIDRWAGEVGLARSLRTPALRKPAARPERVVPARTRPHRRRRVPVALALSFGAFVAACTIGIASSSRNGDQAASSNTGSSGAAPTGPPQFDGAGDSIGEPDRLAHDTWLERRKSAISLVGTSGTSRVVVRRASRHGRIVFSGVLRPSVTLNVSGRRIWIRLESPSAVRVVVNGRRIPIAHDARTIVVTENGVVAPRMRVLDVGTPPPAVEPPPSTDTAPPEAIPVSDSTPPDEPETTDVSDAAPATPPTDSTSTATDSTSTPTASDTDTTTGSTAAVDPATPAQGTPVADSTSGTATAPADVPADAKPPDTTQS
ncbi:MAG TPA: hypothetical protein VH306_14690 [Gaiellaceae bacterium]|jgi:hypothetical protein